MGFWIPAFAGMTVMKWAVDNFADVERGGFVEACGVR